MSVKKGQALDNQCSGTLIQWHCQLGILKAMKNIRLNKRENEHLTFH